MSKEEFRKIGVQTPLSVIVHGASRLGYILAKTLLEQGSKVVIIDQYDEESKNTIINLKKLGEVDFIDFRGIEEFIRVIGRIDYLYYNQAELLDKNITFTSREFLEESNRLDLSLKAASRFNSKFTLLSTMELNRQLAYQLMAPNYINPTPYSAIELQKYSETLVAEYHDKSKSNVRIIRLGNIIGEGFPKDKNTVLGKLFYDAVNSSEIEIVGDGLDTHYVINPSDMLYGILKLSFSEKTKGEVISLCNNHEYTTLSFAYKLLELNAGATEIKFVQEAEKKNLVQTQYVPAPNADQYDWKQNVTIEKTIIEELEETYSQSNKKWENKPDKEKEVNKRLEEIKKSAEFTSEPTENKRKTVQTSKTSFGVFLEGVLLPFTAIGKLFKSASGKFTPPNIQSFIITTIILGLLFYFLLGPAISIGISTYLSYKESKNVASQISAMNFEEAIYPLEKIKNYSANSLESFKRLKWLFTITAQEDLYENSYQLYFAVQQGAQGAKEACEALIPLGTYAREFEPALSFGTTETLTTREYREELTQLNLNREKILKASNDIILSMQIAESVDVGVFPGFMQSTISDIKDTCISISNIIGPMQNIVTFLPELLGVDERQSYLIVLQNPGELRSTGGWISSYAIIGVEGGQIRELTVDDVYNLEGMLKTQDKYFSAPQSMRDALDVDSWSFSTSNWYPDMEQASQDMQYFVAQAGRSYDVNGVIAIDITFLQKLLDVWDGVNLPGEAEKITSANIYDRIFEMHDSFTPGESQKSEFLTNLINEILKKIASADIEEYQEISTAVLDSLDNKNIIVSLEDPTANNFFMEKGWAGVIDQSYYGAPVVVDWNWGANKANLYLNKSTVLKLEYLSDVEVKYTYSTTVENTSEANTYPEGDYVNYMRIYLPDNAQLSTVQGFENNLYDIYSEDGFKVVGGWFNVPTGMTRVFELKYSLIKQTGSTYFPLSIRGSNLDTNLKIFKQPGAMNEKLKIDILYPDSWEITNYEGLNKVSNFLSFQDDFVKDLEFDLVWSIDN